MKRIILISSSILILVLLTFRMLNKHGGKLNKEREWYLENLNFNVTGIIDTVQIMNFSHGLVYFHLTGGNFDGNREIQLKRRLKLHSELFLLIREKDGVLEMASEHADGFLKRDSIIINSDKNEIVTFRNGALHSKNELLPSLRGHEY